MSWMNTLSAAPVQYLEDRDGQVTERADIPLLIEAAKRFQERSDSFAQGKGQICLDMAAKLDRYGHYASTKQADFARKLIEWSKPRQPAQAAQAPTELRVDTLHAVLQRHSKFYVGLVTIVRKNQDQLCWVKHDDYDGVIGKIDHGVVSLFDARLRGAGIDRGEIVKLLVELNADPLEAAKKHGKLAGRCCSCGRDLTNDGSIEAGIGPVCAEKFAF